MRRLLAALAVAAAAAAPAAASPPRLEGPFGSGAAQVWLLRPAGAIRTIVVFAHGWKATPPLAAASARQFEPWLLHLAAAGDAVLFPRYQLGGDAPGPAFVAALRSGLRTGFARLHASAPVVVVGYSVGASLAVYYAAAARSWRLPQPVAVDSVFPAGFFAGVPASRLPERVSVLVQVGDRDTTAGRPGAAPIWAWLAGHARKRYELVRSVDGFSADHAAPKETTPAARRAFWRRLDALIAAARS